MQMEYGLIWEDKKRPIFGLPISFTKYQLTETNLIIRTVLLNIKEEEIRLYRIMDITLKCSLFDRLFGVGTIICHSGDISTPNFEIRCVKDAKKVKNMLAELVDNQRKKYNVRSSEFMGVDMN